MRAPRLPRIATALLALLAACPATSAESVAVLTGLVGKPLSSAPESAPHVRSAGALGLVIDRAPGGWVRVLGSAGDSGWLHASTGRAVSATLAVADPLDTSLATTLPDDPGAPGWATATGARDVRMLAVSPKAYRFDPRYLRGSGLANYLAADVNPHSAPLFRIRAGEAEGWASPDALKVRLDQEAGDELATWKPCGEPRYTGLTRAPFLDQVSAVLAARFKQAEGPVSALVCAADGSAGMALFPASGPQGTSMLVFFDAESQHGLRMPRADGGIPVLLSAERLDLDGDGREDWLASLAAHSSHDDGSTLVAVPAGAQRATVVHYQPIDGGGMPAWWVELRRAGSRLWFGSGGSPGEGPNAVAAELEANAPAAFAPVASAHAVVLATGLERLQARRLALQYAAVAALPETVGVDAANTWMAAAVFGSREAAEAWRRTRGIGELVPVGGQALTVRSQAQPLQ